ncbi:MAG: glycosyltransferase [Treponema sp.]|nr:glycosyltransferase [Treponema sp.]
MKILFVVSWYSSKDAEVLKEGIFHYEQTIALKKYADVAIYFPFDNSIETDFSDTIEHDIRIFRRNNKNKSRIIKNINYLKDYKTIKKLFSPDIIHAHVASGVGMIVARWKKIFNTPYILTEHMPVEMMNLNIRKNFKKFKYIYNNSSKNICVSKDLCQKLQNLYPEIIFSVIYNGISLKLYDDSFIKNINLNHKINFGIVGVFYDKEVKGYQYLLPAIKNLVIKGFDICLHICGGGEYLDYYKTMSSNLGITDNCIFYGQIENNHVYSIISKMDFIISASLYESAGLSVEEAMLLGKPLVVTNSGGASSLVTENSAIIVEKGNTEALENGIEKMIKTYKKYNSESIKQYALNNFEINSITNKYLQIYKELLNNKLRGH